VNVEGRERFFRAIAERIDVARVEEVHVFPAIRQGGRESGVAVLNLRPLPPETEGGEVEAATGADMDDVDADAPPPPRQPQRFTVLRAHYRLQLKGPDRGKWEVAVVEEADAPAATVDEVVRGVHERAGGWSTEGPERLTGDEFRAALVEEPWSATR